MGIILVSIWEYVARPVWDNLGYAMQKIGHKGKCQNFFAATKKIEWLFSCFLILLQEGIFMKNLLVKTMVGIFMFSMVTLAFSTNSNAEKRITFGGGPAGGTFQVVANAIQVYQPVKDIEGINVKAQTSAGSVENLRKTNAGKQDMSVVYSGHVWLGRNGKMKNDPRKYEDVMAVAWLYGAPAQLVVRADEVTYAIAVAV